MVVWGCLRSFLAEINFFEIVAPSGSGSEVLCFRKPPKTTEITENHRKLKKIEKSGSGKSRISYPLQSGKKRVKNVTEEEKSKKSRFWVSIISRGKKFRRTRWNHFQVDSKKWFSWPSFFSLPLISMAFEKVCCKDLPLSRNTIFKFFWGGHLVGK